MSVPLGHSATVLLCWWETLDLVSADLADLCFTAHQNRETTADHPPPWHSAQPNILTFRDKNKSVSPFFPFNAASTIIFFFSTALRSHVSNFLVLQFCAAVAKFCQNSSTHPSVFLLLCCLFRFLSFLLNVLFILFCVSPGTLQNWIENKHTPSPLLLCLD